MDIGVNAFKTQHSSTPLLQHSLEIIQATAPLRRMTSRVLWRYRELHPATI
jgi:hypothetical protein